MDLELVSSLANLGGLGLFAWVIYQTQLRIIRRLDRQDKALAAIEARMDGVPVPEVVTWVDTRRHRTPRDTEEENK